MQTSFLSRYRNFLVGAALLLGGVALAQTASPLTIWPHPYLFYQVEGSPDGAVSFSNLLPIETGSMLVGDRVRNGVEDSVQGMFGYGFGYGLPGGLPNGAKIVKATVELREAGSPSRVGDVNGLGGLYLQRNFWLNNQRAIAVGTPDATAKNIPLPFYGHATYDVTPIVQAFVARGEASCGFTLRFANLNNKNSRTDTLAFRPGILTLTYSLPVAPTPTAKPVPTATPKPTATSTPIATPTPVPTPAKLQVVYNVASSTTTTELKVFDEATHFSRALTSSGDGSSIMGAWSPDKKQIAFSRNSGKGRYDLYLVNADGTGLRQLTNTPNFDEASPRWSPDGTRLVYSYDNLPPFGDPTTYDPNNGVYVLTVATGATRRVFAQPIPGRPDWSPNGSQIFCGGLDTTFQKGVFVVTPDGTFVRRIPINDFVPTPRISPDGNQIVWGVMDTHLYDITLQREVDPPYPGFHPTWTSDGQILLETHGNAFAYDPKTKKMRDLGFKGTGLDAR